MQLALTFLCALVVLIYLLQRRKNHGGQRGHGPQIHKLANRPSWYSYIEIYRPVSFVIFDSVIKYSNHLTRQHNTPEHFVWI